MKRFLILAGLVSFVYSLSFAVKAKPGLLDYTQADGSIVKILLHGDERFHYATTPDGCLLLYNEQGSYEYASMGDDGLPEPSGILANEPSQIVAAKINLIREQDFLKMPVSTVEKFKANARFSSRSATPKYRYSTSAFPTTGQPHSLVVIVEYQDVSFQDSNPHAYYEDFLNGENFSRNNATGSCRQFYIDASNGAFVPTFDLYGPIKLSNKRAYYGSGRDDPNAYQMVVEAVRALDDTVDFSVYDHNDDGYVDSIYVIYAGKGENDGGPAESVWPYSWELEEEGVDLYADGVKFNTYGVSNELRGNGTIDGIGTFTHEFGHVLGLPDLYNTVSSDYSTPDEWSTMDSGSYNNESRTPPTFSSFERYSLGWLEPEEVFCSGNYSLNNLGDSNTAYILTTEENPDEFFLLENRQKTGWDSALPGHGMLVWHIDFKQNQWDNNTVNNNPNHQYVELIRADNKKASSAASLAADPFPGTGYVSEFSYSTSPALKSWLGNQLNVTAIKDIAENSGVITFNALATQDRTPDGVLNVSDTEPDNLLVIGNQLFCHVGEESVFDVSGRLVGKVSPSAPLSLSHGIYFVRNKKIFIR